MQESMMSLKDQINNDLKEAMRSKDQQRLDTLRMLKSAVKYNEIDAGHELNDQELLAVVGKEAKQRRDSIAEYDKAGRTDLVRQEQAELAILEAYLPRQLSADEIKARARAVIADMGVTDIKGIGPVMKRLTTELKGQADGKLINQVVRDLLGPA
jgi:uncharacterized protein